MQTFDAQVQSAKLNWLSSFQKGQVVKAGRILLLVDCFPIGLLVKRCSKIHQGPRRHLSNLNKRVKILLEVELLKIKLL